MPSPIDQSTLMISVPSKPLPPTRGLLTNTAQIQIDWSSLLTSLETGGSPITSYNIQWDAGTN